MNKHTDAEIEIYSKAKELYMQLLQLRSGNLTVEDIIWIIRNNPEDLYSATYFSYMPSDYKDPRFPIRQWHIDQLQNKYNEFLQKSMAGL